MVDFIKENPIPLKDVAARFHVCVKTVRDWAKGVGGRKLATGKVGGKVYTTSESIQRFVNQTEVVEYVQPSAAEREYQDDLRKPREGRG
jgi:hypothetical protein